MTASERPAGAPFQAPPSARRIYQEAPREVSLGALDHALGYRAVVPAEAELRHLWYQGVQGVPIPDLADIDLAMALDEGIHVPRVLPVALERMLAYPQRPLPELPLLARACGRAARWVKATAPALVQETRTALGHVLEALGRPAPSVRDDGASSLDPASPARIRLEVERALADLDAVEPPPSPHRAPPPPRAERRSAPKGPAVRSPHGP